MKNKKISIQSIYFYNLIVFLSFTLAIRFTSSSLKVWYIFLVLFVSSVFETIFFYNKNERSFKPISYDKAIEVFLLGFGSTIFLIGSILFIIFLLI